MSNENENAAIDVSAQGIQQLAKLLFLSEQGPIEGSDLDSVRESRKTLWQEERKIYQNRARRLVRLASSGGSISIAFRDEALLLD